MLFETIPPEASMCEAIHRNAPAPLSNFTPSEPRPEAQPPKPRPHRGPWLRLLSEVLALAGPSTEFISHKERPWSSATFTGVRHSIAMTFQGVDAITEGEALIEALPDHEFSIPNYLVADASVVQVEHYKSPAPHMMLEIELLLLDDR